VLFVFGWLRRWAARHGVADGQCGAVTVMQRFGGALNANPPNSYEDSSCQETNYSYERFFAFFSAFQGLAQSAVGRVF